MTEATTREQIAAQAEAAARNREAGLMKWCNLTVGVACFVSVGVAFSRLDILWALLGVFFGVANVCSAVAQFLEERETA